MSNIFKSKRILEVGCGPGLHAEIIANSLIQAGSIFVCTDFSESMIN